jgi:hypothetical protein
MPAHEHVTFERVMAAMLEARGVIPGPNGEWVRSTTFAGPNLVTDEQLRFINERRGEHEIEGLQKYQWVENLAEAVRTLDQDGEAAPWPFMSVFWIRLHGIIAELRAGWIADFRGMGIDPATYAPNPGSPLTLGLETFRRIEAIRQQFTDDELIYADYRRQTEGHPTQSQYSVRWSHGNGGQVLDRRGIPALGGREFTVAEMDAAVRRVLAAHPSEPAIAVAFARKIREPLGPLVEILRRDNARA